MRKFLRCFQNCGSVGINWPEPSAAASSRCWQSPASIMSRPELLLLDEPSIGLAPQIVENIAEVITKINKAGVTVFLSEQNAQIALMVTKRGYILENGELVLEGSSRDLLHNEKVKKAYLGA